MPQREIVVITGASAGIGRATAHEFARHGARIALLARDAERLERARAEVEDLGGEALVVPADVADAAQVEDAARQVERELGPFDVWVNNAMVTIFSPLERISAEEYRRATEVTYLGTVWGTMAALKRMRARDHGVIVQVGSALAYRSIPLQAPYCGAKHAIRGFTNSVRSELLHDGSQVHLTMVQLAAFNTPQFAWGCTHMEHCSQPVPPIFQPEIAARGIYFAAHNRRREVFVGASAVKAMLGNKIAPGLADRMLAKSGYTGQQTEELVSPNRPNNLFQTVPGDFRAHGGFDARAKDRSGQLWWTMHRWSISAVIAGLVIFAGVLLATIWL
jgi:short-subunit dehydrogenase